MSVLVKNMQMPKSCGCCPMCYCDHYGYVMCALISEEVNLKTRFPDCPLVEIPPHGRLIDADELANKTFYNPISAPYITYRTFCDAPTVIEAEGETE